MKIEIQLNFCRQDFEEIYFRENHGNYFKSPTTKSSFRILVISTLVLIPVLIYSFKNESGVLLTFYGIAYVVVLYNYIHSFWILKKWRTQIKRYLNEMEKIDRNTIILSDNYFALMQDKMETIEKWSNFSSAKIFKNHISLEGKENYLFPQKSMSRENFITLSDYISDKFKQ